MKQAVDEYFNRLQRRVEGESMLPSEVRTSGNRHDWYKDGGKYESIMFVQPTKGSMLKKQVEKAAKENRLKIKVVEKAGLTVKNVLQRSNPFERTNCGRIDCPLCPRGILGICRERGCVYEVKCKEDGRVYPGQTGRSMYERIGEEIRAWRNRLESSPLARHSELYHGGREFDIEVRVVHRCFGKASRRLISEAVTIDEVDDENTMNSKKEWTYVSLSKVGLS